MSYHTVKHLIPLSDGLSVETTYVDHEAKHIICFSTQVGCPLKCGFCVSAYRGFVRNLTTAEMVDQCELVIGAEQLVSRSRTVGGDRPILFSAMGEGEPMANTTAVLGALTRLTNMHGGRTALSTQVPSKYSLVEELLDIDKLQISIHAGRTETRRLLLGDKALPIGTLTNEVRALGHKNVDWNYVVIEEVNDTLAEVRGLVEWLPEGSHIKLNLLNMIPQQPAWMVPGDREAFGRILTEAGFDVELYETDGADVGAACGQLSYMEALA